MAKIRKIMTAGPLTIECIYPAPSPRDPEPVRRAKKNQSTEARRYLNLKYAYQKLELQLAANIRPGDWFLTLSYRDDALPPNRKAAMKDLSAFLRRMRSRRKHPWCYFYRLEHKHSRGTRYHFHIVMTAGNESREDMEAIWRNGNVELHKINITPAKPYEALARYMTKESPDKLGQRLWCHSLGIRKPETDRIRMPDDGDIQAPEGAAVLDDSGTVRTAYGSWRRIKFLRFPIS